MKNKDIIIFIVFIVFIFIVVTCNVISIICKIHWLILIWLNLGFSILFYTILDIIKTNLDIKYTKYEDLLASIQTSSAYKEKVFDRLLKTLYLQNINSFLKSLWHSIDEEPTLKSSILIKCKDGSSEYFLAYEYNPRKDTYWPDYIKIYGITQWLYLEDLSEKK